MKISRQRWITILSILGMFVAGYLTYIHLDNVPIFCGDSNSCELVNSSRYAFIGTIPIALPGFGMYVALLILSLIPNTDDRVWPSQVLFGLALIGFLYSVYLTYIELFVLQAICWWCASSFVLITLIFLLALPRRAVPVEN
jgi:uncharacterized membrane protein